MSVGMFFSFRRALLALTSLLLLTCYPAWALDYELKGLDRDDLEDNIELHLAQIELTNNTLDEPTEERIIRSVNTALQPFGFYNAEVT
ncbi:MAG TPA: hypothetical protein DCW59_11850, partial [Alteromonas sp.]|nr:hypothetical protein [Alteromonas sp.]